MATNRNFIVKNGIQVGSTANVVGDFTSNSYSLSANTLQVRPTAVFNFLNSSTLDSRITFTRSSTATYVNQQGIIVSAPINTPRLNYDPATKQPLGLLIEGQKTNLFTFSQDINSTNWFNPSSVLTPNAATSPDGTLNATKIIPTATSGTGFSKNVSVTLNGMYTQSVYAKAAENSAFQMQLPAATFGSGTDRLAQFDLISGTVTSGSTAKIVDAGNGWYRCSLTASASLGSGSVSIQHYVMDNVSANGVDGLYVWGAQFEAGGMPTSYIPTNTSTVTRTDDKVYVEGNNFTSFYNFNESTFSVDLNIPYRNLNSPNDRFPVLVGLSNNTYDNSLNLFFRTNSNEVSYIIRKNNDQLSDTVELASGYSYGANTIKASFSYNNTTGISNITDGINSYTHDATTDSIFSGIPYPGIDFNIIGIGGNYHTQGSLDYLNGHIRKITYYNTAFSVADLLKL